MDLDYSSAVDSILDKLRDGSSLSFNISAIEELVLVHRLISFVKVDRTQNRASHCLANFARAEGRTDFWHGSGPECLLQVLDHDHILIPNEVVFYPQKNG